VPLLLADLDNTLIDRAGAFSRWAWEFTAARAGSEADAHWLVAAERKLRHTGLDREVAGWVISEGVGLRKPDPEIFRFAAIQARQPLDGALMIGDSAEADISGARNAGLPAVWLHRGRPWPLTSFRPGHTADGFPAAVKIVLAAPACTTR
jgi:putative hydrolase of the HAD superfamily